MKIGIEAQRIFRTKKHGMDIVALEMIKALQKIDRENEYYVFVKKGPDNRCLPRAENFHIIELNSATYADWEQIVLPNALKRYGIELLHCTANTAPLFLKIPYIVTLHDIIYLEKIDFSGSWYQNAGNLYRRWVVPKIIRKANHIITVSDYEKKRICDRLHIEPSRVSVIYNGISRRFKCYEAQEKQHIKKRFNLPDRFMFFLGNTAPKKNMEGVLKAYSLYTRKTASPLPLVIAESTQKQVGKLLEKHRLNHLQPHIHFTGYLPHDVLPVVYNLCTFFLYPSLRESFGIPVIEAMACGAPVITSKTSSMPEVAGGAAWLVNPFSPEDIADAMARLTLNPSLRSQLREKGFGRATRFNWENTARQAHTIYEEINANRYGANHYRIQTGRGSQAA